MKNLVTIADGRIEYSFYEVQRPAAPTIVMLHEGLGALSLWRDLPRKLSNLINCSVFVYSRRRISVEIVQYAHHELTSPKSQKPRNNNSTNKHLRPCQPPQDVCGCRTIIVYQPAKRSIRAIFGQKQLDTILTQGRVIKPQTRLMKKRHGVF